MSIYDPGIELGAGNMETLTKGHFSPICNPEVSSNSWGCLINSWTLPPNPLSSQATYLWVHLWKMGSLDGCWLDWDMLEVNASLE